MSDALTEINRDQWRQEAFERYLGALCAWAESGFTAEGRIPVRAAAEDTDLVRGGYWSSATNLSARIDIRLDDLAAGDKPTWARLLRAAADEYRIKDRLMKVSPFSPMQPVFVDFGFGFSTYNGALDGVIHQAVREAGFDAVGGRKYMLLLPPDALAGIEVVPLDFPKKATTP